MKRDIIEIFFLILFLTIFKGYTQNIPSKENSQIPSDSVRSKSPNKKLLLSAGVNASSYLFEDCKWQLGYRLGLTLNFILSRRITLTLTFSYTRINTAPKNVEGYYYGDYPENYIYKTLKDYQISLGLIELPILLSYKIRDNIRYSYHLLFGPGLVISVKDYSQIKNVTVTDEIVGTYDSYPIDPYEYHTWANSGFNLNAGIRINVKRYYLDIMYTYYPYVIKEINKLNTVSLIFSIDLGD